MFLYIMYAENYLKEVFDMANKPIAKLAINKERFIDYIHSKGVSIGKLGQEIDRTEKH